MQTKGSIILITGRRNVGKTSFCFRLIQAGRNWGLDPAGVTSPGVFQGNQKIRIEVEDIRSGERKHLAGLEMTPEVETATEHWFFNRDALAWGDECFGKALPCGLFFVDELGPLEFQQGQGWLAGLRAVDARQYRAAFVVVRPELIETAKRRWPDADVVQITRLNRRLTVLLWLLRVRLGLY